MRFTSESNSLFGKRSLVSCSWFVQIKSIAPRATFKCHERV